MARGDGWPQGVALSCPFLAHPDVAEQKLWSPRSLGTRGPLTDPCLIEAQLSPPGRGTACCLVERSSRSHPHPYECSGQAALLAASSQGPLRTSISFLPDAENSVNLCERNLLPAAPTGADAPSCWVHGVCPQGASRGVPLCRTQQSPLRAPKATP